MNFERLRYIRELHNLKQIDIANLMNISQKSYSRWETGESIIPLKRLIQFCNYFHVSLDYALNLTKENNEPKIEMILNRKQIGKKLKEVRLKNKVTQQELATLLHTTHSTISAYESGKTVLLTAFAYQICKTYHVSLDWLCVE